MTFLLMLNINDEDLGEKILKSSRTFISKSELWVRGYTQTHRHTDTHINTMTQPDLGARLNENIAASLLSYDCMP